MICKVSSGLEVAVEPRVTLSSWSSCKHHSVAERLLSHVTMRGLPGAEDQTSGFVPARHELYQLSYLPSPFEIIICILSDQSSEQFEECSYLTIPSSTTLYIHLCMSIYVYVLFMYNYNSVRIYSEFKTRLCHKWWHIS